MRNNELYWSGLSATPYAAEIVLSEYTEVNCAAVLEWLNRWSK